MMRRSSLLLAVTSMAAAATLASCNKTSEPARAHAAVASGGTESGGGYVAARGEGGGEGGGEGYASRTAYKKREAVPDFHGEPMWSDNRQHTSAENAHYHCNKSGPDIGAKSFDDCLTKVHAFLDHPPAGAKTLTRSNGDKLIYDPKANMFAVARKDGAPRTFFKPRDGADYWKQQQAEADSPSGYRSNRSSQGGGYGRSSYRSEGGGD